MKQGSHNTTKAQFLCKQHSQAGMLGTQCLPDIKERFGGLFVACLTGDQEVEGEAHERHETIPRVQKHREGQPSLRDHDKNEQRKQPLSVGANLRTIRIYTEHSRAPGRVGA